jgi:hypothetical protein
MRTVAIVVVLLTCVQCGGDDAQFHASYAPTYAKGGTVSVFGLFKDGRMNPELWDQLGPTLLRKSGCETAYSVDFVAKNPTLSAAVDGAVRAGGVTEGLLEQFAPVAKGDSILVISMAGHPPVKTGPTEMHMKPQTPGRMTRPASPYESTTPTDHSVFEVSVSLYSVRERRSVAALSMTYGGNDVDRAISRFAERLAAEMPVQACAGWNWDAQVDEEKVRRAGDE